MPLIALYLLGLPDGSRHCYWSFGIQSRVVPATAEVVLGLVVIVDSVAEHCSGERLGVAVEGVGRGYVE